jgi:hypothetical protein
MDVRSTWVFLQFHAREVAVIALVVAVVTGFLALTFLPYRSSNFGFGPEWDCSNPGKGESVCVKRGADNPG